MEISVLAPKQLDTIGEFPFLKPPEHSLNLLGGGVSVQSCTPSSSSSLQAVDLIAAVQRFSARFKMTWF